MLHKQPFLKDNVNYTNQEYAILSKESVPRIFHREIS